MKKLFFSLILILGFLSFGVASANDLCWWDTANCQSSCFLYETEEPCNADEMCWWDGGRCTLTCVRYVTEEPCNADEMCWWNGDFCQIGCEGKYMTKESCEADELCGWLPSGGCDFICYNYPTEETCEGTSGGAEGAGIIPIGGDFVSSSLGWINDLFGGLWPLIALAIGLPLAFWAIHKVIGIVRKRADADDRKIKKMLKKAKRL